MLAKTQTQYQGSLFSTFSEQLNPNHPLSKLGQEIKWQVFEEAFKGHYSEKMGKPGKPIRRMVGLLILKHIRNLSDESVVEQWLENVYFQQFCGEQLFAQKPPCSPTELVEFRKRIGESGIELILQESIRINGPDGEEKEAIADTTVQEKNITYPTDDKLYKKILDRCHKIIAEEKTEVRQSYKRTLKKIAIDQRFRTNPKNYKKAKKADRRVKTIAGRLVRELERNLPSDHKYQTELALFHKVLNQKRSDTNKIYSLHETQVKCISKGKQHKKFEFGNKVSIMSTKESGVIIGAISFEQNLYDGHTIKEALNQQKKLTGIQLETVYVDRGYRGITEYEKTKIESPKIKSNDSQAIKKKKRNGFRRRASIEPMISHLKQDYRLGRNYYKGILGDQINVMLAASAWNFKRMINKWKQNPLIDIFDTFCILIQFIRNQMEWKKLVRNFHMAHS